MSYFYYDNTKITFDKFKAIPVVDGYRTLPNGAKIGAGAEIGARAAIWRATAAASASPRWKMNN